MNKLLALASIIVFAFLLLPSQLFAATNTYYVTQNGKGTRSGESLANGMAVSDFNALSGSGYAGDTFYFSGTFTTRIVVKNIKGTSGHPVTLDGYEAGDCDPLNSECSSSAVLSEGLAVGDRSAGPDYITIQDFRMTRTTISTNSVLSVQPNTSVTTDAGWIENITIRRNFVYEAPASLFRLVRTKYATIDRNKFTHYGQGINATQGINLGTSEDLIFSNNIAGHDESSYPSNCISAEMIELHALQRALIEKNDIYGAPNQSGIRPKEDGFPPYSGNTDDVIIRFNKVHDNVGDGTAQGAESAGKGIYALTRDSQSISNIYIYGNLIYNNTVANVMVGTEVDGFYVWSNILIGSGRNGVVVYTKSGQTPPSDVYIYNNTIVRNGTLGETKNGRGGITVSSGTNIHVENNIFWNNRPGGGNSKYNQIFSSVVLSSLAHNTLYHESSTATYYYHYDGNFKTLKTMQDNYNMENGLHPGDIADPRFLNPKGADNKHDTADDDYRLASKSPAIDSGAKLSHCFSVTIQGVHYTPCFDDALDPKKTDWTTIPPTVRTAKQGDHGAWERGAYVYSSGAYNSAILPPNNLKIIVD